jgi:hypothetical protein
MRRIVLLLLIGTLGACASAPRHVALRSSVVANPSGELWVLVGAEDGLPPSPESRQQLVAAWSAEATARCSGEFIGNPSVQVTSFAPPGQPFADPFALGTLTRLTAAFGSAHCTSLFASAATR